MFAVFERRINGKWSSLLDKTPVPVPLCPNTSVIDKRSTRTIAQFYAPFPFDFICLDVEPIPLMWRTCQFIQWNWSRAHLKLHNQQNISRYRRSTQSKLIAESSNCVSETENSRSIKNIYIRDTHPTINYLDSSVQEVINFFFSRMKFQSPELWT